MVVSLKNLPVLVLDCQATSSHPDRGFLLEIGWAKTLASEINDSAPNVETHFLNPPEGSDIPRRVSRVTGITIEDLDGAHPSNEVWESLSKTAREITISGGQPLCPTVIHFSRFEEPFLHLLHRLHSPESSFPFIFICTHEIAKRLLPCLPRRGLRAVAGYFGYSTAKLRRTANHVSATIYIWRKMVEQLETEKNIRTLPELRNWLAETPGSSRSGRAYPMERSIRLGLPDQPGVYRMLRSNGDILYVGKADSLKKRVNSYFRKRSCHAEHILEMLSQARDLEVTVTHSAMEAAILESDEIKRLSPPYNISLQKGERRLRFSSVDFRNSCPEADECHSIGPLPSNVIQAFSSIADILERGFKDQQEDSNLWANLLGLPNKYAPERECISHGFKLFSQNHAAFLEGNNISGRFLMTGSHLWRERLEKKTKVDLESNETLLETAEEQEQLSEMRDWNPEKVEKAIESIILHGAWLIRRSRWYCILSESTIFWEENLTGELKENLLVIERGQIMHSELVSKGAEIPIPPGYQKTFGERQRNFDLSSYDRMRVLTTEIRRIISKSGNISIRFTPKVMLNKEKLKKVLEWV
jgi:DNA polymerase III subunit epsilon